MIGPLPVRRVVLCTGAADSARARYAARRLARELPDARVHVFYQTGCRHTGGSPASRPTRATGLERFRKSCSGTPLSSPLNKGGKRGVDHYTITDLALKARYWSARGWWKRWGWGVWHRRYLVGCARRVDRLLRRATPSGPAPAEERTVASVNDRPDDIHGIKPDVLLIFGGGRVEVDVLDVASVALNIHGGKLPEYRGVHSALFALSEGRFDQVGVTLHQAARAVDTGEIVRWQPIEPARSPSLHHLMFTLFETGVDLAIDTIRKLPDAALETFPQTGTAHQFRTRDINAQVIRAAYSHLRRWRRDARRAPLNGGFRCCFD